MVAPYNPRGRYVGGISSIANTIFENQKFLNEENVYIEKFDTCRINRKSKDNKISFSNFKNFLLLRKDLLKFAKKQDHDVIYFHSSVKFALLKDLLILSKIKKNFDYQCVIHIHFADIDKILTGIRIVDTLIIKLLQTLDSVVFLSQKTKDEFCERGLDKNKCKVLYNFSTFECDEETLNKKNSQKVDVLKLLFVGSIDERKGIYDLLNSLEGLSIPFNLDICGKPIDFENENKFSNILKRFGTNVRYCGYLSGKEKVKKFIDSDVLILPSYGEGLPVVIMEAYSAGCAVVATNVGAIPEILNENNGFLISPGNASEIKESLFSIYNGDLRKLQKNNQICSKSFSFKNFCHSFAGICLGE